MYRSGQQEDDSSEDPQPSSNVRGASMQPRNTGGQIAPMGGILGALYISTFYVRGAQCVGSTPRPREQSPRTKC